MAKTSVLTPQSEDFPRWYQDVVAKAELAENGPVRGTMVIRPYGWAIWERMQAELDRRIKDAGAVNAYMAKWLQSYRDLPMLLNQWANVVRWELRPRLFLRTTEFLWQEGHTCHASEDDARAYALRILHDVYEDFMVSVLGLPVLSGLKTRRETFAGADNSWTCEGMMGDGKALQMGTSHLLGQNFAKVFDTQFLTESGEREYAWQTSWGVSTRLVGALIMGHGDDAGLRVPPTPAPIQVVVLVVKDEGGAGEKAAALAAQLQAGGLRVELDTRDTTFGRR